MDCVFIEGLTIDAIIGIYEQERVTPQPVVLDIEMRFDNREAAATGDIKHALDYAAVAEMATEHVQQGEYQLVETLAEDLATKITTVFAVEWVKIKVSKPQAVAHASAVGIVIERGRGE